MALIKINKDGIIEISQEAFEDLLKQFNVSFCLKKDSIEFETPFEKKTKNTEEVEIELSSENFNTLAMMAHDQDITFNQLCENILKELILKEGCNGKEEN